MTEKDAKWHHSGDSDESALQTRRRKEISFDIEETFEQNVGLAEAVKRGATMDRGSRANVAAVTRAVVRN